MRVSARQATRLAAVVFALWCSIGCAGATLFNVSMNTSGLNGITGLLVFDYIDGGPPDNFVNLGPVAGNGPYQFGPDFGEVQISFTFGSLLTFSFTTTDKPPDGGSNPDSFSFFILDASGQDFLVTTSDLTGSNALFVYAIGVGPDGLAVYTPDQAGVSIQVAAAPEPGSLALLAIAFAALGWLSPVRSRRRLRLSATALQTARR